MTDRDSKDMKEMVYSAKVGQWSTVFRILDKNPKFVNCIPEGRTWAALHQAIYLNNASAMKKLFEYPACDVDIETKADAVGHGPGRTPLVLAKMLSKEDGRDRNDLASFLKEKSEERHGGCIPSYVTVKEGVKVDRVGSPLLLDALAQYKKTFNPDEIDTQELFNTTMKEVFKYNGELGHWKDAMEKISQSVGAFCVKAAELLTNDSDPFRKESRDRFYARVVKLYTSDHIYRQTNKALMRKSFSEDWNPTGELSPYALLLDVLLFNWKVLERVSTPTYRAMHIEKDDLKNYYKGNQFVWMYFVSAAMIKENALMRNTLFVINNSTATYWQPRKLDSPDLHKLNESEALYPPGAEVKVRSVKSRSDFKESDYEYNYDNIITVDLVYKSIELN